MSQLQIGEQIPHFIFNTPWKNNTDFFSATEGRRVVVFFLRYYGCTTCQFQIHNLIKDYPLFVQAGVEVFVVLQSQPETIRDHIKQEELPFVLILDPTQTLYQLYDIGSRDPNQDRTPEHQAKVKKIRELGFTHGTYEGNELQLPATFIISPQHRVEYAHYGNESSDIPTNDVLLQTINKLS